MTELIIWNLILFGGLTMVSLQVYHLTKYIKRSDEEKIKEWVLKVNKKTDEYVNENEEYIRRIQDDFSN